MNDKMKVNTEELKMIANSMRNKKDSIVEYYNDSIKNILESSEKCIIESGLDYSELSNLINESISDLDYKLSELIEVLVNRIIPSYEDLTDNIRTTFTNTFANEMSDLLDVDKEI